MDPKTIETYSKLKDGQKKLLIKLVSSKYETEIDLIFDICLLVISINHPSYNAESDVVLNQLAKHFQILP